MHWRIYPVIYGLPILRHLASSRGSTLFSRPGIAFAIVSAATFLGLAAVSYRLYGMQFLEESYLYHAKRIDPRHNFSPYFLPAYLRSEGAGPAGDIGW